MTTAPTAPPLDLPMRTARRGDHPGIALAVIVICQLLIILDATVVNIALPRIHTSLHFSPTGLSWVLNAYALTFGGLLLLGGRAGDIFGRRRTFTVGIALFAVASLAGGLATSSGALLTARAVQGVGAAIAAPSTLALITTNFSGAARTRALALLSATSAAGASLGLIVGGVLTEWASWRWALFLNVPIGLAAILLAPLFITEPGRLPGRLDLSGALTATTGMVALVYGFIRASSSGWADGLTLATLGAAVVLLAAFGLVELRARQPIMPLRLLTHRVRGTGYAMMLLLAAAMFGMFFFVLQFLQEVLGLSPVRAGVAFLPLTGGLFLVARNIPRLLPRLGLTPLLATGAALVTAGLLWLTQLTTSSGYAAGVLGPLLLLGVGGGMSFIPLSVAVMSSVPPPDSGAAAGTLQTCQQAGGALGVAVLVTVFGTVTRHERPGGSAVEAFTHGVTSALTVSVLFAGAALVLALAVRPRSAVP